MLIGGTNGKALLILSLLGLLVLPVSSRAGGPNLQATKPAQTNRNNAGVIVRSSTLDASDPSTSYTYDLLGRITTGLYDNDLCIAYAYDANGNRTSQTNTISAAPESAMWGTGSWGCYRWTAP